MPNVRKVNFKKNGKAIKGLKMHKSESNMIVEASPQVGQYKLINIKNIKEWAF